MIATHRRRADALPPATVPTGNTRSSQANVGLLEVRISGHSAHTPLSHTLRPTTPCTFQHPTPSPQLTPLPHSTPSYVFTFLYLTTPNTPLPHTLPHSTPPHLHPPTPSYNLFLSLPPFPSIILGAFHGTRKWQSRALLHAGVYS